jgi:nucleoid DNA-binding protein
LIYITLLGENMFITKDDIILTLASNLGITKRESHAATNVILNTMFEELINAGEVKVRGFGFFKAKYYRPRKARNPKTGETLSLAARYLVRFKSSKTLQAKL